MHAFSFQSISRLLVLLLFFSAGNALYSYQFYKQETFFNAVSDKKVTIRGTIESIDPLDNPRFNYKIILHLDSVKSDAHSPWHSIDASIMIYTRIMKDIQVGDYIEIDNIQFKKVTKNDFNMYLLKEQLTASLFLQSFDHTLLKRPTLHAPKIIFYVKENILHTLENKMSNDTFQLFSSLFLGNRAIVKKEMETTKEQFKIWGISHYLARSGLHLVIFVIIWNFILGLLPLSFLIKQFLIVFIILAYALLTWSSVSFERALLMFLLYKLCVVTRLPLYYTHLITLVTLMVLLYNPLELFFLDFQLSFGITFALAWFNSIQGAKARLII